ncbi:MAG: lytic transglycosylase domain-containing protein [Pseudomonadota bacterium]
MRVLLSALLILAVVFGGVVSGVAPAQSKPLPRPEGLALIPTPAPLAVRPQVPADLLNLALAAAAKDRWADARSFARQSGDPLAEDIVLWLRLRAGIGEWSEYSDFLARNGDWPGLASLRRAGEYLMPTTLTPAEIGQFFTVQMPQTGTGSLRLAKALSATGRDWAADEVILRAWLELPMSAPERAAMTRDYAALLDGMQTERVDMLLWNGYTREAEAMLGDVSADWQALAKARIATRRDAEGLQMLIWNVPPSLKDHPGLAYERYLYRVNKGRWDDAEDFIYSQSKSSAMLGEPEFWMKRRPGLARQALRRGDVGRAYTIAASNFGETGGDFAEAEWVAGYIALTRLDDAEKATEHFSRFKDVVSTPISSGRAGYWLGLAHERAGRTEDATDAFRYGARHQTSFYGQLAAERAGIAVDATISGTGEVAELPDDPILESSVVRAARLFIAAGQDGRAAQFLRHAAEDQPAETRTALAQIAIDAGMTHVGIRVAKDAAREGLILPGPYYPLPEMAEGDWPVPTEFALAVARQESELNAVARSHAGAQGLMQLMPATARQVAGQLGLAHSPARLVRDPNYNATLGTAYLAQMLRRYDGSYMLAAAAYNAGPGRVDQWLKTYGDPRAAGADPVLWIETIPFNETRNYVMRVLEGLHVYRARLSGQTSPIRLASEMVRTG